MWYLCVSPMITNPFFITCYPLRQITDDNICYLWSDKTTNTWCDIWTSVPEVGILGRDKCFWRRSPHISTSKITKAAADSMAHAKPAWKGPVTGRVMLLMDYLAYCKLLFGHVRFASEVYQLCSFYLQRICLRHHCPPNPRNIMYQRSL